MPPGRKMVQVEFGVALRGIRRSLIDLFFIHRLHGFEGNLSHHWQASDLVNATPQPGKGLKPLVPDDSFQEDGME